ARPSRSRERSASRLPKAYGTRRHAKRHTAAPGVTRTVSLSEPRVTWTLSVQAVAANRHGGIMDRTSVAVSPASGVPAPAHPERCRGRLLELLHSPRAQPLILIVAPAGFGKSTLAATYARDSGAALAWLALRPSDRDSREFFTRLADTLED